MGAPTRSSRSPQSLEASQMSRAPRSAVAAVFLSVMLVLRRIGARILPASRPSASVDH
jgi:hypothetical protein